MNTKIVYAVVSNEKDIYLEQTLSSVYSLRLYNPEAHVILIVDEDTNKTIQGKRSEILKYITEKIIVKAPQEYTQVQKSRYLKTTLRQNIKGDFLFIDSDTIIVDTLSDIDSFKGDIGAVSDFHINLKQHYGFKGIQHKAQILNWQINDSSPYYNSGVIYVKDNTNTANFFKQWHNEWKNHLEKGFHEDQPSFNKTNFQLDNIIQPLDGIWNCQILWNGIPFLHQAKIIHFFGSWKYSGFSVYKFSQKELYYKIKETGYLTQDIISEIKNGKGAFNIPSSFCSEKDIIFLDTWIIRSLKKLYIHSPLLFKSINLSLFYTMSPLRILFRKLK